MENLLFINACVRGERSRTLKLARRFLDAYRAAHPDTVITERDLCAARLQPQYPEVLAERDALWSAGKLEQPMFEPAWQFAAADKLVIAAPFWDMSFPAILKIYLERISVTDLTFGYSEEGAMVGLCRLCFSCQSHFNFLLRRYVFRSVHGSLFIQNSLMLL